MTNLMTAEFAVTDDLDDLLGTSPTPDGALRQCAISLRASADNLDKLADRLAGKPVTLEGDDPFILIEGPEDVLLPLIADGTLREALDDDEDEHDDDVELLDEDDEV